jgi:putative FmdB family regulatory protein
MRYTYKCPTCGNECEVYESMIEHGKVAHICHECGDLLETVVTGGSGFQLKGVSWAGDGYCNHGHACDKKDGGGPVGNGIISKEPK